MRWLAILLLAAPAAEMRHFAYERPLVRQAPAAGQSCVPLDAAVFAHAAPGLADLRLYRGSDQLPFAVRTVEAEKPAAASLTPLNLGMREGQVVFDAAMPEGLYKDLELTVDARDFLATVTVTGRDAEGGAGTKLGEYTIFDLSAQGLGRSTVLHLPESDLRSLHFTVSGPVAAAKFTAIMVQREPLEQPRYVTVVSTAQAVQQGRDTVFTFAVPAGVPVERLVVEPGAAPAEFSRDLTVSAQAKAATANAGIGNFSQDERLLRVHRTVNGRPIDEEALAFALGRRTVPEASVVTVAIHNGSDLPLAVQAVRLEMEERDLCFDAGPGSGYALYYGDAALEAPVYEYARLFALDRAAHPVALGAEIPNPAYVARPDGRPFTERHPWLLWVGLVAAIGVLALVAMRTARTGLPAR